MYGDSVASGGGAVAFGMKPVRNDGGDELSCRAGKCAAMPCVDSWVLTGEVSGNAFLCFCFFVIRDAAVSLGLRLRDDEGAGVPREGAILGESRKQESMRT